MILDAIMGLLVALLTGVVGLLPAWSPPSSITSLGDSIGSAVGSVNGVFPVGTLGACLAIMVGSRLFVFAWGFIVWVYRLIPFKLT